jgi:hypothetical protein
MGVESTGCHFRIDVYGGNNPLLKKLVQGSTYFPRYEDVEEQWSLRGYKM